MLGVCSVPALAGSPALMIRDAVLMSGPGHAYPTGTTAVATTRVSVERCQRQWCRILAGGALGWVRLDDIGFGQFPRPQWLSGPKFAIGSGAGTVCFYSAADFAGTRLCLPSGAVVHDLALLGRDNAVASVRVSGAASALVCRDRSFGSYCQLIVKDAPRLSKFLGRAVSSVHVY